MKKKFLKVFILFVIIVAGGILVWRHFVFAPVSTPMPTMVLSPTPILVLDEDIANWEIYKNERLGFEIKYPGAIEIFEENNGLALTHSIPFEHHNPCDFKGDPVDVLEKLTDFDVHLEIIDGRDIIEAMILKESESFARDFISVNKVKTQPGFIDEIAIGALKGYRIATGIEGCGKYTYYFVLASKKTLFIEHSFIAELKPIIADYEKYLKLPGVIPPEKEEELFNQIFSTFKFMTENGLLDWKNFRNDEYGFLFKYPPNFTVLNDNFSSPGRKYLEMGDNSLPEKPTFELYADFEGFGQYFPDKEYFIKRNKDGVEIVQIKDLPKTQDNNDGEKIIVTNFEADLGKRSYFFVFKLKEGGEDLEPIFKQLISSFRFF